MRWKDTDNLNNHNVSIYTANVRLQVLKQLSSDSIRWRFSYTLLCGRPIGRITRLARPSVCLSVCVSVRLFVRLSVRAHNSKTKKHRKLKIGTHVPRVLCITVTNLNVFSQWRK